MSFPTDPGSVDPEPAPAPAAETTGPRDRPSVAPWNSDWVRSPDGAGEPAGSRGREEEGLGSVPRLGGAEELALGTEVPEPAGGLVIPAGELPSECAEGVVPGLTAAADPKVPAPGSPPLFLVAPPSLDLPELVPSARGPDVLRAERPGSGVASKRARRQLSISLHWEGEKPIHFSQGSCLVQDLQAGQTECGSQPLPGRTWEQIAHRAPSDMIDTRNIFNQL